jgi:hypothetical protein
MMMKEPSVLDYVKSLLDPRRIRISLSDYEEADLHKYDDAESAQYFDEIEKKDEIRGTPVERAYFNWPWRTTMARLLALTGQFLFEPPRAGAFPGILFYLLSAGFLIWAFVTGEWQCSQQSVGVKLPFSGRFRVKAFYFLLPAIVLSFISFIDGRYNFVNTLLWLLSIFYCFVVLWDGTAEDVFSKYLYPIRDFFKKPKIKFNIDLFGILFLIALGLILAFRFADLQQVPNEMTSEHMEFIMDIEDVQDGVFPVFSARNGGRGTLFIYIAALLKSIFPGLEYFSILKVTSGIAGIITLVYIYFLGKEISSQRVGLFAMLLAGFSYWGAVLSRIGLEFVLYPMLVAPTLYYIIRGFKKRNRNSFLMAGLCIGIGLHGYTAFRYMLIVVLIAVILFALHQKKSGESRQILWAVATMLMTCLIVVIPILPFMIKEPGLFSYKPLPLIHLQDYYVDGAIFPIFFNNLWEAVTMPFWQNGDVWTLGVSNRPALGVFSGALFFIGLITLIMRYAKTRNWIDLFLLISVPLLVLPSAVSLAHPVENPSLARAGGVLVVVVIIAGLAFDAILNAIEMKNPGRTGKTSAVIVALLLLGLIYFQNHQLVFEDYKNQYEQSALNTSEIGTVIRGFADSVGTPETSFVVPYPHWVDTRLVGINAGFSGRDFALWPEQFEAIGNYGGSKMIVIKPEDKENLVILQDLYPEGVLSYYDSVYDEKDFMIYLIPGEGSSPSN